MALSIDTLIDSIEKLINPFLPNSNYGYLIIKNSFKKMIMEKFPLSAAPMSR